jgi:hypothetical protein
MERYRTTIIMAIALLVLGGLALFLNNQNASSPGTPTPVPVTYVWQEENPVAAINVVSGTSKVNLTKDPLLGSWQITEPVQKPADLFAVSGVADSLQKLQAMFTLTGTSDLTQYGLGPGAMTVTLTFSDTQGTKRTFNVGTSTPDGTGYYVNTEGASNIYVVSNTTLEPMRSWLTTPPVQQPSPTPVPVTIVPTATQTATAVPGATETAGPAGPSAPTATLSVAQPAPTVTP